MRNALTIHHRDAHLGWDAALEPLAVVTPGTTVAFDVIDAAGGQLSPTSTAADVAALDPARANPVNGPVAVEGARPGDALRVTILELAPTGWGWSGIIPGFGLLAGDFPDPALLHWHDLDGGTARLGDVAAIPVRPFPGTVGVAPAAPGPHSVIPPRRVGGNLDVKDLTAGTTLWLPIEVDQAKLSIGDTHAAQGDGEVCGTAIETPMSVTVRLDVEPGAAGPAPRFETAGPVSRHHDELGYHVTTGVGPDLHRCAQDAVRAMIDLLGAARGLDAETAYLLCSVTADLRLLEVVDAPSWVVGCYLPKAVLV